MPALRRGLGLGLLAGLAISAAALAAPPPTEGPAADGPTARHFRMSSAVMEPTLRQGETFLARTSALLPIERGGVYVVRKRGAEYVVRVIGLPGDIVEVVGGGVFLEAGSVRYSDEGTADITASCASGTPRVRREHLPGGASHLIMACNLNFGRDRAPIRIPAGHYFLMGDNRSNAADSRFDTPGFGLGLVPEQDFVAQAERILLSTDPTRIGQGID
jgi:signal peptidase I